MGCWSWIALVGGVWLVIVMFWLAMARMSATADRMNDEMKDYNERVGFRWH